MDELVLTEEEEKQVQEGEAAAHLLDSPAFLLAVERIRTQCAEAILTSTPEQGKEREHLYNLSRGLSAVTEELLSIQAQGQSIVENAALQTTPDTEAVHAETYDHDVSY